MKKYKCTFQVSRIKSNCPYYVSDIVEMLGVSSRTVYYWMQEGLPPVDNQKPYIFHGTDLREFLAKRQRKRKRKCKEDEMFCCKCRQPRRVIDNKTSLILTKSMNPMLTGNCEVCNTQINRAVSRKVLEETKKSLTQERQGQHTYQSVGLLPFVITNIQE